MYSDDDDSSSEAPSPTIVVRDDQTRNQQLAALRCLAGGPSSSSPSGVPVADRSTDNVHGATQEDASIPESLLSRSAVLIDARVLGEPGVHPDLTGAVVEMSYMIVTHLLSSELARVSRRETTLSQPDVNARAMPRREKNILLDSVKHRVQHIHGIGAKLLGVDENNATIKALEAYRTHFDAVRHSPEATESEHFSMGNIESSSGLAAERARLRTWISQMLTLANSGARHAAAEEDGPIAFLTLRGDCVSEVRRALTFAQRELRIRLPRYRVFALEDVLYGPGASHENLIGFAEADRDWGKYACLYHRRLPIQEHGYHIHCCRWTVAFMNRILTDAADQLEQHLEANEVDEARGASAPFVEDD